MNRKKTLILFLVGIVSYQFLMGMLGLRETAIYFITNPYNIFIIFALLSFLDIVSRTKLNKVALPTILIVSFAIVVIIFNYIPYKEFPFNLIKNLQYFWGPIFLVSGFVFFLKLTTAQKFKYQSINETFVSYVLFVAATITFAEYIYVNVLILPIEYLGHITEISNEFGIASSSRFFIMRPFGITSYPQPNGVILTALISLNYLYKRRIDWLCLYGFMALLITFTGTAYLAFLMMLPLLTKRPFLHATYSGLALIATTIMMDYIKDYNVVFYKLSFSYIEYNVFERFQVLVIDNFMSNFTLVNYLFGSSEPNFNVGTGVTHDYAYFDVFYEGGIVALIAYIALYSFIVRYSLSEQIKKGHAYYFTIVMLIANIHYPTLNFYVGQFLFSILAAINFWMRTPMRNIAFYYAK